MAKEPTNKEAEQALPSIDAVKPSEEGGPVARSGFNYQDEIALGFLIEMLETSSILKVHCETHDDVVIVRSGEGLAVLLAEFVQVKSHAGKLWSTADLCERKKGVAGTSIFETSLARDRYREKSRFRIVTLLPVVKDLQLLTLACGASGREVDGVGFKNLQSQIEERCPSAKSGKGNGVAYWLENCHWDVRHSEESIRKDNLLRLLRLSGKEGRQLLPEQAEVLVEELRALAKAAGDAKWEPNRDQKVITREALRGWWERRTREMIEGAAVPSANKLVEKMTEAGLPTELIRLAVEMRRDYSAAARTPHYMDSGEGERLQGRVKSEVMSLRARFVAGQIDVDSASFHALCLAHMDTVNAEQPAGSVNRSAYLKGCMYDIVDRCLLRFARPVQ